MVILIAALRTTQPKVRTHKSTSHASGGYPKGLHYKSPKYKRQYKRGYKPLKSIGDFRRSVFFRVGR